MKGDDSCCQGGMNKNFKGSGCECMEEVETPKKVKGKTAKAVMKEENHCCGSCGSH